MPLLRHQRLHVPDLLRILDNAAITTKEAHPAHTLNTLPDPALLIFIRLIHQRLRLVIRVEVVGHEVVVAVVDDAVDQRREGARVAERVAADAVEDGGERGVDGWP